MCNIFSVFNNFSNLIIAIATVIALYLAICTFIQSNKIQRENKNINLFNLRIKYFNKLSLDMLDNMDNFLYSFLHVKFENSKTFPLTQSMLEFETKQILFSLFNEADIGVLLNALGEYTNKFAITAKKLEYFINEYPLIYGLTNFEKLKKHLCSQDLMKPLEDTNNQKFQFDFLDEKAENFLKQNR